MSETAHLYEILYPISALVGSHLDYQSFARHYISGSSKYYRGKLIFAELDINFRNPYFRIDEMLANLQPHEDGRPKATKYVSTYRVLEHTDFSALQNLYIATPEGYCLKLEEAPYDYRHQEGYVRLFAEVTPLSMMVLSDYNFLEFGQFITDPNNSVGAPKMFYTQVDLDIEEFLRELEDNPLKPSPLPEIHPALLRDGYREIRQYKNKHTKGLSLANSLGTISFKSLRHGFMFASSQGNKFYPMPSSHEIEKMNYKFWKNM